MNRICIVVGSLAKPGGAERVATWLANAWSCAGKEVIVVALSMPDKEPFFPLAHGVKLRAIWSGLSSGNPIQSAMVSFRNLAALRKVFAEVNPECVISFLDVNNILSILASSRFQGPVIVSERCSPDGMLRLQRRWRLLRFLTYPWADGLVLQTEHALSFFSARVRARARVIPNPVLPAPDGEQNPPGNAAQAKMHHSLIGLGSLRAVKGFDRLIDAFSQISSKHPDWNLCIYGEGSCRPQLEQQVSGLGLGHRIHLPGVTREPYVRLREADLFVLPSRNEGFPNALAEAMACGVPVISFDCHSGPRELIRDGIDGLLVPEGDIDGLARQLDRLMSNPDERARLGRNAPEVLQRFSSERILAMWEAAVLEASTRHGTKPSTRQPRTRMVQGLDTHRV